MDRRTFLSTGTLAAAATFSRPGTALAAPAGLSDLAIVRQALDLHPGLYRYQSPRQFERNFAAFTEAWDSAPDRVAKFLALSRLTAQVRCGHTQCNPFNQSGAVVADLFDRPTRLPFAFRWIAGQMIVTGDSGAQTGIARGSVIERLNGTVPPALLPRC